ncbi:MAG: hypothetical protein KJ040_11085, partial [Gammaproteobacteria bacterium]|nr:hypothetical protein [Gammaproteobacteria bacterium]
MNAEVSSIWRDACQRNRDAIPQLAWLVDLRDSALGVLTDRGLPDSNQEDWRYTSLADYFQRAAGTAGTLVPDSTPGDQVQLILGDGR